MAAITRISNMKCVFRCLRNDITIPSSRRTQSIRSIHRPVSLSMVPAVKEKNVAYPPVTPRWPPGIWGELEEKRAWELYEQGAEIQDITSLWDKWNKLRATEHYFFTIEPFVKNSPPRLLPYQKYLTKTHLISSQLPSVYQTIDVETQVGILKPIIAKNLVLEKLLVREKYRELKENPTMDITEEQIEQEISERLINSVIRPMVEYISNTCDHLYMAQYDEKPIHKAFWAVAGIREDCEELSDDKYLNLQYSYQPSITVRVEQPLPVFVSQDEEVCNHPDIVTDMHFIPKVYELSGRKNVGEINPGFLTKSPFNDPCPAEFGQLTVSCIPSLNNLRDQYSSGEICDLATGCGLVTAFGSALTQAHTQGFNWWDDITYPFTTQSIVFDGKNIFFYAYQLNTIALWKIGENGVRVNNVCWALPEMPLFDSINDDTVEGLNDDALRTLLQFMKLQPKDRGVNLRPYISEKVDDVQTYINRIDEPLIERPHPPRLYAKSKKVKLVSPVDVTLQEIDKMYQRAEEHWNERRGRFTPGPRQLKPSNRIREKPWHYLPDKALKEDNLGVKCPIET